MTEKLRYAVVPTRGDRVWTLRMCLDALRPQIDRLVLVDNSDDGIAAQDLHDSGWIPPDYGYTLRKDPTQPPNLSRLWNYGIDQARDNWVAVVNDDAIVPPGWYEYLTQQMTANGALAAGYGQSPALHRNPGTTPLDQRLPGYAFVLDGAAGLRADEQFHWWCGDNDLDMQARKAGGTLVLAGDPVRHMFPDRSTLQNPVLQARTGEDMRLFVQKWGFRPW